MSNKTSPSISSRRQFLTSTLPAGAFFGLGCSHVFALPETLAGRQTPGRKSKFLENSGMSVKDVWTFTYEMIVPTFQNMAKDIGRGKFIEMVKKASSESWGQRGRFLSKSIGIFFLIHSQ